MHRRLLQIKTAVTRLTHSKSLVLALVLVAFSGGSAAAIQFASGETAFNGPLRLLRTAVSQVTIEDYPVYYQFAVEVPAKLDEPLGRLQIDLPTEYGPFGLYLPNPDQVRAFIPTDPYAQAPQSPERNLPVRASVGRERILIIFPEPVPPGNVVTVEWGPVRNPRQDGIYQFGVTAYPRGDAPRGLYVGNGRITIRRGGRG